MLILPKWETRASNRGERKWAQLDKKVDPVVSGNSNRVPPAGKGVWKRERVFQNENQMVDGLPADF